MFAIEKWLRKLNVIYLRMQQSKSHSKWLEASRLLSLEAQPSQAKPNWTNLNIIHLQPTQSQQTEM